jgi:N-methylhydantoinase B
MGQFRGGDGLVREIELLAPSQVTLLADRRKFAPYGLEGGEPGAFGLLSVIHEGEDKPESQPGKCSLLLDAGDLLHLETPGGGGWGKA